MQNRVLAVALLVGADTLVSCRPSTGTSGAAPEVQARASGTPDPASSEKGGYAEAAAAVPPIVGDAGTPLTIGTGAGAAPPEGMVYVPGGTFMMGMPASITQGAPPQQQTIGSFFLDRLEVTTGAYLACVKAGSCEPPAQKPGCNGSAKKPKVAHPINCLTKQQAEGYCAQQGKRLPTQAEWEFAARGTDGRIYPWGDDLPSEQLCWQGRKGAETEMTCPVGSYPQGASPFGALDMAGNVAEWTSTENKEAAGPGAFYVRGGGFPLDDLARADGPDTHDVRSDNPRSFGDDSVLRDVGVRCALDAAKSGRSQ